MKAGVVDRIGSIVVEDRPVPTIGKDQALVKVAHAGLCGPTDDAILKGLHPRARFPLVLGHEFTGTIVGIGADAAGFGIGDRIVVNPLLWCGTCDTCRRGDSYVCENLRLVGIDCDGGFQEYAAVPVSCLVRVPAGLSLKVAALCEPQAVGVHAVREAGFGIGDSAVVFGAGPIGLFTAEACRRAGGGTVCVIDIDGRRRALAETLGFPAFESVGAIDRDVGSGFGFAFETTGAQKVLGDVFRRLRVKGTLAIVGKYDETAPFDLHTVLFHEITVKGMRVYRPEEFHAALAMLAADPGHFEPMISDCFPVERIQEVFDVFSSRRNLARIFVSFE
jgi:(R,R)-butanediol dehydrogenase / meso-butanediol dehydrogenase / diacetyl reductase